MPLTGTVGKKGELYPPKSIRQQIGLAPGSHVLYSVENHELLVKRVPTIKEALEMPKFGKTTTAEFEKFRKDFYKKLVERGEK